MDIANPQLVDNLSGEIFRYMRSIETIYQPRANYLDFNKNLTQRQRAKQVDYLLRLTHEMSLKRQTFYLCVSMLDRFFELVKLTDQDHYDLIAFTCLFCAAKYEETTFPTVNDFVYLSSNRFTKEKILQTELEVLETLGWRLNHVSPLSFMDQASKGLNLEAKTYFFAQSLVELLIYKGESLKYKNSLIGCACLLISLQLLKPSINLSGIEVSSRLVKMSLCDSFGLKKVCTEIFQFAKSIFSKMEEQESAVFMKFKKGYYAEVSQLFETLKLEDLAF